MAEIQEVSTSYKTWDKAASAWKKLSFWTKAKDVILGSTKDLETKIETMDNNITDEYDSTSTYAVNDLCIKDDLIYKCNTAIDTAEAWTASHWTATNIGDEISGLNNNLSSVKMVELLPIIFRSAGTAQLVDDIDNYDLLIFQSYQGGANGVRRVMTTKICTPSEFKKTTSVYCVICDLDATYGQSYYYNTNTTVSLATKTNEEYIFNIIGIKF